MYNTLSAIQDETAFLELELLAFTDKQATFITLDYTTRDLNGLRFTSVHSYESGLSI
jgi:hypothetical protein